MKKRNHLSLASTVIMLVVMPFLLSCAQVDVPGARNLKIPSPTVANEKERAINEVPDSVLYLPLGSDVLVPDSDGAEGLPTEQVGPFELRSETLAGALQLILADYEIPLAFETEDGLTRTITVANLKGPLDRVVKKVCGLADLYCSYEEGLLVIKDTQTFTVTIPPVGGENDIMTSLASGLQAITGTSPITEEGTRTIIYEATNRTAELAERYFQRIRSSTALIVFEIYIWEVALNSDNAMGIDWQKLGNIGKFNTGINVSQLLSSDSAPISIGLPTTGDASIGTDDVLQFISSYGAVKTISQPQITVLSGAEATLRAADTINYVSSLTRTTDNGDVSVSTETDSVDTGFTMTISSAWDNATIYGTIDIELEEFQEFQEFSDGIGGLINLPRTTERSLQTQIRIRPGDSLLIGGLVRERDQYDKDGAGFNEPIIPTSRGVTTSNNELVFLMKPRVIVYTTDKLANTAAKASSIAMQTMENTTENAEEDLNSVEVFPDTGTLSKEMLNPAL